MTATIGRERASRPGRRGDHAELREEPEEVEISPPLDNLVVTEAKDIDARHGHRTVRGRRPEKFAAVRARCRETLDDVTAFRDEQVHVAAPVGESSPLVAAAARKSAASPLTPAIGGVVSDKVFGQYWSTAERPACVKVPE